MISERFEGMCLWWRTHESSKDEYDANDDESLNGCESVRLGDLVGDAVEDVDEAEEDGDEDGHPTGDTLGGHEEADPGHNDEHTSWEVVGDLAPQSQLKSSHRIVPWEKSFLSLFDRLDAFKLFCTSHFQKIDG